jgi:hypothetical protein
MSNTVTVIGWAHVEIMGHKQHWGLVSEVDRFGSRMCLVQVPSLKCVGPWSAEYTYRGSAIHLIEVVGEDAVMAHLRGEDIPEHHDTIPAPESDDSEEIQVVRAETLEAGPLEF